MGRSTKTSRKKKLGSPNNAGSHGLSPGSLVFIGEKKTEKVTYEFIRYTNEGSEVRELPDVDYAILALKEGGIKWLNVYGLHDVESIEKLGKAVGLDRLVMEDILNTSQRPKLDNRESYIFVEIQQIVFSEQNACFVGEQVSFILGMGYVIAFHERRGPFFDSVKYRIGKSTGNHRKRAADYLLYTLIDTVVDNYFAVLEKMGDRLDFLEEQIIANPSPEVLGKVYTFKRELIDLRRSVYPLREVVSAFERTETDLVNTDLRWFIRDLYDHTIQVIETMETYRDSASGLVDLYMSSVSNRMNNVMKVLTIITTIFVPLTFIAGVYGMNFEFMPGIHTHDGFWIACGSMMVITIGMFFFFRFKKWL